MELLLYDPRTTQSSRDLPMSDGTQAISRAAELLSIVVRAEDPMTYTGLVDHTGLAHSTASRVLEALERSDLLERDNDGLYRGGRLFAHYAARHDRMAALLSAAEPVLQRIGDDTGETVNLAVARGRSATHVTQMDTPHMVGAMNWIDIEVPPHCSALGKAMYAFGALPFPEGRLERRTEHTITQLNTLERELDSVREQGFATTRSEFEDGLDAVLAPQRDELRTVVPGGRSARNRCPPNEVTASVDQNRRPNPRRRQPQYGFNYGPLD